MTTKPGVSPGLLRLLVLLLPVGALCWLLLIVALVGVWSR